MNTEPAFLLSGATGFLGQRLLRRLLQNQARVIVLSRGGHGPGGTRASAEARMEQLLEELGCASYRAQLAVIETDLADIEVESLAFRIAGCLRQFGASQLLAVNVAASLKMDFPGQDPVRREATRQLNQRTNVLGLERLLHALDRAEAINAGGVPVLKGLVHFSTCYAHGRRSGLIPEDALDPAALAENSYEQSKREGEFRVARWQAERAHRVPVTVIRPSIVTGPDTRDGYLAWLDILSEPVRVDRLSGWMRWLIGIATPGARLVDVVAAARRRLHLPVIPLLGNPGGVLDFIDAGDVEKYSWLAIQRHRDEALAPELRYLHLSNPEAPTLRKVLDMTMSALDHADLGPRFRIMRGYWLFAGLLGLFSAIPVAGLMLRGLYTRTSMLKPYLMRSSGTRFATSATAAYFAEIGVRYQTRRIDTDYVRTLIGAPPPAAMPPEPMFATNPAAMPDEVAV